MAIFSSITAIYIRIGFLFTLAYLSVKDVTAVLNHPFVLLLSQAMSLPMLNMNPFGAQLGLISLIFCMLAISDLIPLLEKNKKYFKSLVPFRLMMYFTIAVVSYLYESNLYIHNNAIFVYCFCELWLNFLIVTALKEEESKKGSEEEESNSSDEADSMDQSGVETDEDDDELGHSEERSDSASKRN
ncbi:HHL297Cp [Eremothecium sinecaudum]|uniref:HHL297Cp n=1 Tax=Eremothecium sinecaudum TaxID=45286 RepID=A0A109V0K0_9SACH|nr:HHL297Cp [Eremothecium sinecaudum]AMD22473.1 HHL297Cp [Eremothecium sinecaudum]